MNNKEKGYTLIEFIVGMSIFVGVIAITTAIFIRGFKVQRVLLGEMAVNNSMNFVLEQIVRDIRTGYDFSVIDGGQSIIFTNRDEKRTVYSLENEVLVRSVGGSSAPLTSDNIQLSGLDFSIFDKELCDPWRVTVKMAVKSKSSQTAPIWVQTSVSSRVIPADINEVRFGSCRRYIN